MPRKIEGPPVSGKFYRSGPHAALASNYSCRMAGLPNGSSIGACLEVSLLRKAASGSEAAMRMVSEWTAKPEVVEGDYCEHCGKKPPIVFKHVYEQPSPKEGNRPPLESDLIEQLKTRVPPMFGDPRAVESARARSGGRVTSYFWAGSPGAPNPPPEVVQMSYACALSWERGPKVYAAFVTLIELPPEKPDATPDEKRAAEKKRIAAYDDYRQALNERWASQEKEPILD